MLTRESVSAGKLPDPFKVAPVILVSVAVHEKLLPVRLLVGVISIVLTPEQIEEELAFVIVGLGFIVTVLVVEYAVSQLLYIIAR